SPYVTYTPLAATTDGLLGRDIVAFDATCTLVVATSTGNHPASSLLCHSDDSSAVPAQSLNTSLTITPHQPKRGRTTFIDESTLRQVLAAEPSFHPLPSGWSITSVVFQNRWLRLALVTTATAESFFYVDISQQVHAHAQTLHPKPCRKFHYKWLQCPPEGRLDCEAKLQAFPDSGQMHRIDSSAVTRFTTDFYGVRGRKRWRPVLPLINTNTFLRALMRCDPIPNKQLKLKTCLSRLRLATTVTLHDVSDAFMKFRVSSALGSFFQFYWRNGYYQFSRMIYGSSIAP
ncbi:hypothetical protein FOL46_009337, partial [Perkinsus olseni]